MSAEVEVTKFLLQFLKERLTYYVSLKMGAESEFQKLMGELRLLERFLMDSDNVSKTSSKFYREKVIQISELVHDVEDTIDTCMTKKEAAKTKFISKFKQKLGTGMAQKVRNLRQEKVTPILNGIIKFGTQQHHGESISETQHHHGESSASSENLAAQRIEVLLSNQDEFVDFKDEETIIRYLQEPKEKLDVISITGMPGIGKTTCANKIFRHKTIVDAFPVRIWSHVSQGFDIRDVLCNITNTLAPKDVNAIPTIEDLIKIVKGCLKDKKYLLVMDDVWTVEDWNLIKNTLPMDNGNVKVLVTTRDREVATQANISRGAHHLQKLEASESLKLLKLKVFKNSPELYSTELAYVMEKIANKCNGVPLVILLIGGIMEEAFVSSRAPLAWIENWNEVFKNMDRILEEDKKDIISNAVEMSYKNLTRDLKLCFLYTGLFPENHEIPAATLTKLWIAEGFIQPREGQSMEETATKVLNMLANKNLLMVAKKNLEHIKTCRVHYMIRRFCISYAMEENIFRVIKGSDRGVLEPQLSEEQVKQLRRLCFHSNPSIFLSEILNVPCLRSFHCFIKEPLQSDPTHVSSIPHAFNLLRVLNCDSIKFGVFPEVKRLILLKHISLCIDQINALPNHIYELVNLQTLIVDTTSHSIIVKKKIWKMSQLRRFKTKAAISLDDTKGEGKACANLQSMSRLSPGSCTVALSRRAPNLKVLGIRGKLADLFSTFSMEEFRELEKLKLENDLGHESTAASSKRFPMMLAMPALSDNPLCLTQPGCFPPNLRTLSLSKTHLKWAIHMKILATVKTLKVLKLKDNALTGNEWQVGQDVFPELNILVIEKTNLEDWKAPGSHLNFPKLRSLRVKNCLQLKAIPENLARQDKLETLEIEHVRKSVADSARTIDSIITQAQNSSRVPFQLTIGPGCTIP